MAEKTFTQQELDQAESCFPYYQKGVEEGRSHAGMSGETKDEITKLTKIMESLKTDIEWIKKGMERNDSDHEAIMESIKKFVECSEARMSSLEKWRAYMLGGMAVISAFVIPMVIYVFFTHN